MISKAESIKLDAAPEMYAAISLIFAKDIDEMSVINELKNIGICDAKIRKPKYEDEVCVNIAAVQNKCFWELNDVLSEMFSKVEYCLGEIKDIAYKYRGDIYIDIAFCQHGTYPALVICGQNMKNICFLCAGISIDPF